MSLYFSNRLKPYKLYRKETTLPRYKEMFFSHKEAPRCSYFPGSFTLEAAIIFPLLASFFVSILFFFHVMQLEIAVQKALDDTGRKLAVYSAQTEAAASVPAAQILFLKELQETDIAETYIVGGKMGISLLASEFDAREINLHACYRVRLPIRIFWIWEFVLEQQACSRRWNGWSSGSGSEAEDRWVYVTETGNVYHMRGDCTHLELCIRSVRREALAWLRNENGGRYYACQRCAKQMADGDNFYITNQGDRYHRDLNCSGIKRTVFVVRLSEVGARTRCKRCGILE